MMFQSRRTADLHQNAGDVDQALEYLHSVSAQLRSLDRLNPARHILSLAVNLAQVSSSHSTPETNPGNTASCGRDEGRRCQNLSLTKQCLRIGVVDKNRIILHPQTRIPSLELCDDRNIFIAI